MADLCYTCHAAAKQAFDKVHVHAPVAVGECTKCHSAHASPQKTLLVKGESELCFTCHQGMLTRVRGASIHLPFHDPHGEPLESFLRVRDDIRARLIPAVREALGL